MQHVHDKDGKGIPAAEKPEPALSPPPGYDEDWHEKVERAKRAREEGRKAREGKPVVFTWPRYPGVSSS